MIPLPPPAPPQPRVAPAEQLLRTLRKELLHSLHLGRLKPGDRLQSIRSLARERQVDHRVAAQAYHALREEGLVAVIGRSGVCVAEPPAHEILDCADDHADWLVEVLAGSWARGLRTEDLLRLLRGRGDTTALRCVCVESNVDQMTAYCAEIEVATGITPVAVYVKPTDREPLTAAERFQLATQLRGADLVVTTPYHMLPVRQAAAQHGAPVVVLNLNPVLVHAVRARIRAGGLVVVSASAEFGARMKAMYADVIERPGQLRVLLAGDPRLAARLHPGEPVLITRAARAMLPDRVRPPRVVFPHSPTLAQDSLEEIAAVLVRVRPRHDPEPPAPDPTAGPVSSPTPIPLPLPSA